MFKAIIIDDEKNLRERFMRFFPWDRFGFEVIATAKNGFEGLKLIEDLSPDLVFTDIKMPKMDGIQLASKVHTYFPETKVVILSAYSDFDYAQSAIKYNVKGYLVKPLLKEDFIALMSKLQSDGIFETGKLNNQHSDQTEKTRSNTENEYIRFAKKYIQENFNQPITIKDITDQLFIHSAYFSKLFNEQMGIGFSSYLNIVRIEKAKDLIKYSGYQLKDISGQVGFSSHSYFNKVFKEVVGMTPLKFKRGLNDV